MRQILLLPLAALLAMPVFSQTPADTTLTIRNIEIQGTRFAGLSERGDIRGNHDIRIIGIHGDWVCGILYLLRGRGTSCQQADYPDEVIGYVLFHDSCFFHGLLSFPGSVVAK